MRFAVLNFIVRLALIWSELVSSKYHCEIDIDYITIGGSTS
jgi:hypothetical protein